MISSTKLEVVKVNVLRLVLLSDQRGSTEGEEGESAHREGEEEEGGEGENGYADVGG